jgi:hypothetical protein
VFNATPQPLHPQERPGIHYIGGKTKNQMGGCCAEGRITDIRDARMEEKSGK